jgi:hypothetical protein
VTRLPSRPQAFVSLRRSSDCIRHICLIPPRLPSCFRLFILGFSFCPLT